MKSNTLKTISYVALGLGIGSIVASGLTYLVGSKDITEKRRNTGQFLGLWAPTFLVLSEMLDRIATQDDRFLGVSIERGGLGEATRRSKLLVGQR